MDESKWTQRVPTELTPPILSRHTNSSIRPPIGTRFGSSYIETKRGDPFIWRRIDLRFGASDQERQRWSYNHEMYACASTMAHCTRALSSKPHREISEKDLSVCVGTDVTRFSLGNCRVIVYKTSSPGGYSHTHKKDRQRTYNKILRRVPLTTVTVVNQ